MADQLPQWVQNPRQKGFSVEARHPNGTISRAAFGKKGGLLFGRNGQVCDCEVAHKSASRVHACLGFDGDQVQIQDLDSSHGTFVDGVRLEKSAKAHVEPGRTVITIGRCQSEYTLLVDDAEDAGGEEKPGRGVADVAPHHERLDSGQEAGPRNEDVRERVRRGSLPRTGNRGHEREREPMASQRQREAGRGHSHRIAHGKYQPSGRQGSGEEYHDRRPLNAGYRAADYRDDHRNGGRGKDGFLPRGSPPGWGMDSSRRFDARGNGRDHHNSGGHRRSDEPSRHNHRRNGKRSRSPEVPRKRRSAESEGEDERRGAEEQRRKRKTAFDDAPVAATAAAPQQTPAQIVMGMMGAGGIPLPTGMLNAEQKKKLLWGKKAEQVEAAPVNEAFGANRWDTAEFSNDSKKEKFIKLMGVKKVPTVPTAAMAQAQPASPTEREALTREKQDRLLHNVEAQFMAGLRRADGRTVGLGL